MTLPVHFLLPSLPTPSYPSPAEIDRLDEQHSIVVFSFLSSHEKRAKKSGPTNQHILAVISYYFKNLGQKNCKSLAPHLPRNHISVESNFLEHC